MRCRVRHLPSAFISFHPVPLSPSFSFLISVRILHCSRFQPPCSFYPTNSILAVVVPTHFQSSPLLPTSGSICISISMRATLMHSSPLFNITRPRTVFCLPLDTFLHIIRIADRETSPYQSLPSDCMCYDRKSRIIVYSTKTGGAEGESKIDYLFL